ncbi:hypothetical protein SAMN05421678_106267 [Actinopolymorpha cephalotaxi]|uniref:Uncharacterized protein n=1 Tax=Actinopolymorpha cephalotaxi TaxID=504797 RepID=A0A1I2SKQ3_9ACTN|nr:hypothetical protein [Actinopolymorpha cephalotaxi]NYH84016.1 hypothetical protein [Actinopolymorpha cephalotaxi]SFG53485.1 hypothetical protein SAMN05421678_106267 [Actinopolymorpha cephalotaxi]
MAGHRRSRNTGRPLQRRTRCVNRRRRLDERMAAAHTPAERFAAAAEYLRSALAMVPHDLAQAAAEQAANNLIERAEALHSANLRRL